MKFFAAILGVTGAIAFAAPASAACVGNCGVDTPNGDVTAPPAYGPNYSYVSTYQGALGAGEISGVGGTNGSEYLTTSFSGNSGNALNFYFNYVTADGTGAFTDYSFVELLTASDAHVAWLFTARTNPSGVTSPGFGLPANDSTLTPAAVTVAPGATHWDALGSSTGGCYGGPGNGCGSTGWIQSNYTLADSGSYILRFGVTNFGDQSVDSGLAFAGVTVAGNPVPVGSVPEPAIWAMMLLGMGVIGFAARRRQNVSVNYA